MDTPQKKNIVFRFIDMTSDVGGILSAAFLWIIAVIVTYEVFMRYAFNAPTSWVQETSVYLWMAVGLLGAAVALKNDSHFSITIFIDKLSSKNRRRMQILTNFLGFLYSLAFVYQGFLQAKFAYDFKDVSTGLLATPLWIPWLTIPIGGILLALQFINKIAQEFSKGK